MGSSSILHRLRYSRLAGWIRHYAYRTLLSLPRRRQCNLCGWSGRRFLSYRHRHVMCPRCGSQVRHRLIAAALDEQPDATHRLTIAGSRILHISPEYCLALKLGQAARQYVTADYATAIQRLVREAAPQAQVITVRRMSDVVDESLVQERFIAQTASAFSLFGLLLACVGLYGVMSYTVTQRTNEIGIRMALGAERRHVVRLVMREVLLLMTV